MEQKRGVVHGQIPYQEGQEKNILYGYRTH